MKKTVMLSIVLVVLVCAQGFSQSWIVGGEAGLSFGSTKNSGTKTSISGFALSPMVGYVIDDKIDVGGKLILERVEAEIDFPWGGSSGNVITATTFGLAAWGRYYLLSLGSLELRALGEIGFSNTSVDASGQKDIKSFWISAVPNFEYRFTDRVSIYTNIGGVEFTRIWTDGDNSYTDFSLGLSTDQISLGFFLRF
jgi:opacity protein-like surface antigen